MKLLEVCDPVVLMLMIAIFPIFGITLGVVIVEFNSKYCPDLEMGRDILVMFGLILLILIMGTSMGISTYNYICG